MTTITIKNLRLRTIVGIEDFERKNKQDVILNISIESNADQAIAGDDIDHACDYKTITKKIITTVEDSTFYLLEKLTDTVLQLIMEHPRVTAAAVEIDKPHALRFADSVSVKRSAVKKAAP
ncbi:MAG: dihydroneopterin triphosphate 2'-epimerase [Planctomycetes bacterium]|nr:dihydroneopterin triphosphate 2'-epimerase [Planctomycetota bacterium]